MRFQTSNLSVPDGQPELHAPSALYNKGASTYLFAVRLVEKSIAAWAPVSFADQMYIHSKGLSVLFSYKHREAVYWPVGSRSRVAPGFLRKTVPDTGH
jgi:hypothetical protein